MFSRSLLGSSLLLRVEPYFVEPLAHAPCDDAEHITAGLCGQISQLANIRHTLLEGLLCSLNGVGQTLLRCARLCPVADERGRLFDGLLRDLGLSLRNSPQPLNRKLIGLRQRLKVLALSSRDSVDIDPRHAETAQRLGRIEEPIFALGLCHDLLRSSGGKRLFVRRTMS